MISLELPLVLNGGGGPGLESGLAQDYGDVTDKCSDGVCSQGRETTRTPCPLQHQTGYSIALLPQFPYSFNNN